VERLTPEQIRLLEELRELRDSGILTVDEFEFQVAKVLGRPLLVEPSPVDEEPVVPDETVAEEISDEVMREEQDVVNGVPAASDETHESELLEYEFVESATSDFAWLLAEENQVAEPPLISDTSALPIVETESQQNSSGQRKVLIGTTVGLVLIVVIALVALGGGKSDSTSSQIVDSTTTGTENTSIGSSDAPTSLGNTQAPATSSQSVAITTTVPQNASSGNVSRPTAATTPITSPLTTVANPTSVEPIVTALRLSKSHPVFYDWPWDLQQSVTFTALIDNDENVPKLGIDLMLYGPSGLKSIRNFRQVQPGTWEAVQEDVEEFGHGFYEGCWVFTYRGRDKQYDSNKCLGPSVSFEVLEVDRNPPTFSDVSVSPAVVYAGDTVRVSARVVDATEVTNVFVNFEVEGNEGNYVVSCNGFRLTSGDKTDGVWSTDCTLPPFTECVTYPAFAYIWATSPYADYGAFTYRLQVLPLC
jgi:hypothetical protein